MNSIALSLERLSGRDRASEPPSQWNDLLSDDVPPDRPPLPTPAAAPTGREA